MKNILEEAVKRIEKAAFTRGVEVGFKRGEEQGRKETRKQVWLTVFGGERGIKNLDVAHVKGPRTSRAKHPRPGMSVLLDTPAKTSHGKRSPWARFKTPQERAAFVRRTSAKRLKTFQANKLKRLAAATSNI
jgi:hypothetical protein